MKPTFNRLGNGEWAENLKLPALLLYLACSSCSNSAQVKEVNSSGVGGAGGDAQLRPGEKGDLGAFGRCSAPGDNKKTLSIENFENGLRRVGSGGRWISYDDASGGAFTWATVSSEDDKGSRLQVTASGFKEWSGFGVDVGTSSGKELRCALDAKAFMGVRFVAQGRGTVRLRAGTVGTLPQSEGGTCPHGEACYDQPGSIVHLTPEPRLVEIPFCGMGVEGWGAEPAHWDLAELVNIHFVLQTHLQSQGVEFWLDDLELYREEAALTSADCSIACPMNAAPNPSNINPEESHLVLSDGLTLSTFEQPTARCGPLTRRYLSYVPPSLGAPTDAPIVVALHGYGANAESMIEIQTRGQLNSLAKKEGFVVVYGNAAPGNASSADPYFQNTGAWRHAASDDGEVDDVDYLRRMLADLEKRKLITGDNDIFLMGLSNGGGMALQAAAELHDRLSGIALFMPFVGTETPLIPDLSQAPLSHVLLVNSSGDPGLPASHDQILPEQATRWAKALGLSTTKASEVDLPDSVDEGADYAGTHPTVLATQHSSILQADYASETSSAKVRHLTIKRGGHFLPNAVQDTEPSIIERWGLRNQDVDASQVMWEFFKTRQAK